MRSSAIVYGVIPVNIVKSTVAPSRTATAMVFVRTKPRSAPATRDGPVVNVHEKNVQSAVKKDWNVRDPTVVYATMERVPV